MTEDRRQEPEVHPESIDRPQTTDHRPQTRNSAPAPRFLDIPESVASDKSCPYAVMPIPYERSVSYGTGTAGGPEAILRASHETENFDEELLLSTSLRVHTMPAVSVDGLEPEDALELIRQTAVGKFEQEKFPLSLGGEHTVSFPLIQAAQSAHPDLSVLHIDAHLDLRNTYEDSKWSHACVMRRVTELGISTSHIGIRSLCEEEFTFAQDNKLTVVMAREIAEASNESWIRKAVEPLSDTVYISFDIDALDPSLAPGTGTPEPGGMSWYKTLTLLREVISSKTVIGADIVETAPIPGSQVTEFTAARLGQKILTYHRHAQA